MESENQPASQPASQSALFHVSRYGNEENLPNQSPQALKVASLPTEEEAVEVVLASHTPRNIEKRKARSGRKVPDGPGRFNPTSQEWQAILNPPEAAEPKAKKAKPATKEKKLVKKQLLEGQRSLTRKSKALGESMN